MSNQITILQEIESLIDKVNGKLVVTDKNIVEISRNARKASENFHNIKSPSQLNERLSQTSKYTLQLNAYQKERKSLEEALSRAVNKQKLAEEGRSDALIKTRFETQELNKKAKEAAILSSTLATEYQKQSVRLTQLRRKYKDVALTQGENSKEAKRLKKQIDRLDKALKRVDANVGQYQRSVGNYGKAMKSASRAARQMAGAMGFLGGTFLVARVIKDAFNRVREFDKEMQNMAGVLRTTRPQLKAVEDRIKSVASVSIKTSNDVAKMATSLAVLGKRGDDLLNLIEPANNLSIALQATSDETAEFLVQTLNAFGAGSDEAEKYADTIAAIRTSTSLDFQRMRDSFQYITPISKILNKDLEYTGAVVGVLADNGLKAESAGRLLATSQIKLATQGRTLQEALDELNEAYKEGKEGTELLEIANKSFGKQAAKIGVILATQQDRLEEYETKIRQSAGALDDLVGQQLESLDAKLKITTSTWEDFILSLENGEGAFSNALKGGLDVINNILKGLKLLNLTTEEYNESLKNDIITEKYKEIKKAIEENGGITEEQAIKQADIAREKVDNIQTEIDKLKERNKELDFDEGLPSALEIVTGAVLFEKSDQREADTNKKKIEDLTKSLGFYTATLKVHEDQIAKTDETQKDKTKTDKEAQEVINKTIKRLRELIKAERDNIENIDLESEGASEMIKQKQVLIKKYQDEIDAILGTNKARKESKITIEGSIASYEKLISKLEDEQSRLAKNGREWRHYKKKIDEAKRALKNFRIELEGLDLSGLKVGDFESSFERIKKILTSEKEPIEYLDYDLLNSGLDQFKKLEQQKLNIKKYNAEKEKEIAEQTAEYKKQLEEELTRSVISISNSMFDAKIMRYEEDIQRNNDYYAALLDNESLTEEQRQSLEAERDRKNAELEKKKRDTERKAAIFNKLSAIAEITIATIKAVAQIKAQAGVLAANPITAPLAAKALAQIPLVLGIGVAQSAAIAATPIPRYAEGHLEGTHEGKAIINDANGSIYKELVHRKSGALEVFNGRNQVIDMKRGDKIVKATDAESYLNNLSRDDIMKNLHRHIYNANMVNQSYNIERALKIKESNNRIESKLDELIKVNKSKKTKFNVYNNNTISEDLEFLTRKQNTL
ncbi:phage tail tape measure protein [uncultured Winogradskyella sp.]|uniref:phage tail tape measure protein n=1 Tax=uncultured Winogradskyella sp. TaxID=395353 RepID=UPI00260E28A6|nr:phage tail tape measure protein [uncultured Winogradskyella sp.]